MSSTTQGTNRAGRDAYYTPDAVAVAIVRGLRLLRGTVVLEPSAGGGAFVRALVEAGAIVTTIDIDPAAAGLGQGHAAAVCDFLRYRRRHSWIVGNPPFNDAEAHVRHALSLADGGVAFLLRLAFLESTKRAALWREHPPARVDVLSRRPSFTGGGTDSAAYAVFRWEAGHTGPPALGWLDWNAP